MPILVSIYAFAVGREALYDLLPAVAYDIVHSYTIASPSSDGGYRRLDFSLLDPQDVLRIRAGGEVLRLDCVNKLAFGSFTAISLHAEQCLRTEEAFVADDLVCFDGLRKFWALEVAPLVSLTQPIDLLAFPTRDECFDILGDGVCAASSPGVPSVPRKGSQLGC